MTCRFLRWSLLLLGLAVCRPAGAQTDLPEGTLTPETIQTFCAAQGGSECAIGFVSPHTLFLREDWHIPKSMHLRFAAGSSLHITGGLLRFDGGFVGAPSNDVIFPDPDHIRGLAFARPEWFAPAPLSPDSPIPATALAAAYEATVPWGTLYLEPRQYLSPFSGCPGSPLRFLSPRTLVGAGRPQPDDPESPTRLQNGTILLGGITGTAPLRLAHLGIDAGPEASANSLRGCQPPAIFIEQPANHEFVVGDRVEDVSVLTTGAPNMHSVMIAGHRDTLVHGLWLWTLGGTHGLVMKSEDSVVDDFHCRGALADCLIVKSDYATDFLGRANHDRVSHVDIGPLRAGGYVGGIMIEARWDAVRDLEMTDIRQTGSRFGIILLGSNFYHPQGIVIRDWTADSISGACLLSDHAADVTVSGFRCNLAPGAQAGVLLIAGQNTLLEHGVVHCGGSLAACVASPTDGVSDDAHGLVLRDISAEGLSGYLLRSTHDAPDLQSTRLLGMDSRQFVRFDVPLRVRLLTLCANMKPSLRILYTSVASRIAWQPRRYGFLAAFVVLLMISGIWSLRSARRRRSARSV